MTKTIAGGGTAELEVGKVYLNGLGLACRIVEFHRWSGKFLDETGRAYMPEGYDTNLNLDLIEEVPCDTLPE